MDTGYEMMYRIVHEKKQDIDIIDSINKATPKVLGSAVILKQTKNGGKVIDRDNGILYRE